MGKRWRGGKRIINKLVKGRLSEWLGAAVVCSLARGPAKDSHQVAGAGGGGGTLVASQAEEEGCPCKHLLCVLPLYALRGF